MALYLVQHGKALSKQEDPNRPITLEGIHEVGRVASEVARKEMSLTAIIHSGKERAKGTAKIFRDAISESIPLESHENLSPNDDVRSICDELNERDNIMIVGHLPYLSRLISYLICGDEEREVVHVRNGGCIALEKTEKGWRVEWIIVP